MQYNLTKIAALDQPADLKIFVKERPDALAARVEADLHRYAGKKH